jgi:hypothetical protein
MKIIVASLLLTLTFSVVSSARQSNPAPKQASKCPEPIKISSEMRELAEDAFAKLQTLEAVELKADAFYQPASHDADVAVHKAQGRANSPCEIELGLSLQIYQQNIYLYRLGVQNYEQLNTLRAKGINLANPDDSQMWKARQQDSVREIRRILAPQPEQPKTSQPSDSGKLIVQSVPANADVFVDGTFIGNAPATLTLKAGKHTIRMLVSGYKERTKEVSVLTDSEARLLIVLTKSQN